MNISENYVILLVYFWKFSYEGSHLSYNLQEMLANMYEVMVFDGLIGMHIDDIYFGIFVSTIWLSFNYTIIHFQTTFNVRFFGWVYHLSIFSVYNKISDVNISYNYVSIFIYPGYFNSWWLIIYPLSNIPC